MVSSNLGIIYKGCNDSDAIFWYCDPTATILSQANLFSL